MIRFAWLQKHATPVAQAGEFHWYPAAGDRELRASLVEQLAGASRELVLWQLAPERVVWARAFGAVAPSDGRRYTGLAVAIAEGRGGPARLLETLVPLRGEPWCSDLAEPLHPPAACPLPDATGVARALLAGGVAAVAALDDPGLPRALAAVERRMPAWVSARDRRGNLVAGDGSRGRDRVAELAIAPAGSRAARAWRLLCELAGQTGDIDALAAESAREDPSWLATLHAWGREPTSSDVDALAERTGLRAFARLAADRDPARVIAEVRWHALLPRGRRGELLAAIARRAPSLRELVDG
jgi:hypothetical protein